MILAVNWCRVSSGVCAKWLPCHKSCKADIRGTKCVNVLKHMAGVAMFAAGCLQATHSLGGFNEQKPNGSFEVNGNTSTR